MTIALNEVFIHRCVHMNDVHFQHTANMFKTHKQINFVNLLLLGFADEPEEKEEEKEEEASSTPCKICNS